jgi:MYXO-CTERM domain-containing protein
MKLLIRSLVIASAVVFGGPGPAHAHFKLDAPASWANQDSLGLPLKSAPCGQSDPGTPPVATNAVTGLMAGSTVTITVTETVFHPGHYRVALAADQNSLPADPTAHPDTNSPCGTADIMTTPVLPVLADNMLVHTTPFSGPQSFQVTLPAGMTCANCTLQVIEFMSDHPLNVPGGCFYHHCANVAISATGAGSTDGGSTGGGSTDGGSTGGGSTGGDGIKVGCSSGSGASDFGIAIAMLGWLLAWRRRSRAG